MSSIIKAIEYYLPDQILSNETLACEFPEWSIEKIQEKTGISERHIADENQCASDLATCAAEKLFASGACHPTDIDFILLCTQSPDYLLPTTACLLQQRLGIPTSAGALDFNLGCSGYIYGLSLAHGLISTQQARSILLITAETYSKYIVPQDKTVRTIFGDGASASLITQGNTANTGIGHFIFGTDGRGAKNLMVENSGTRALRNTSSSMPILYMNGPEIFTFTLEVIPRLVKELLEKSHLRSNEIELYIFHQANLFILEHLQKSMNIPHEKMFIFLRSCGNTVSSTIPIALREAHASGRVTSGMRVMLIGFGVGYSWGATIITIA